MRHETFGLILSYFPSLELSSINCIVNEHSMCKTICCHRPREKNLLRFRTECEIKNVTKLFLEKCWSYLLKYHVIEAFSKIAKSKGEALKLSFLFLKSRFKLCSQSLLNRIRNRGQVLVASHKKYDSYIAEFLFL